MCDCKKKLIDLTEKHKLCNTVRFENPIKKTKDPEPIIELLEFHRSTECPISTEGTSRVIVNKPYYIIVIRMVFRFHFIF